MGVPPDYAPYSLGDMSSPCVTWLIHMCDLTHSYVWHDSFIHICDMTCSYVCHDSFIRVTWLIHMCDMTHLYVWHDSFIIHQALQLQHVWRDSFICVTRLIHMCDMTHLLAWRDSCKCDMTHWHVTGLIHTWRGWLIRDTTRGSTRCTHEWLIHTCTLTHSHKNGDSYVTQPIFVWLIRMWYGSFL